jgi:hypothetical protein
MTIRQVMARSYRIFLVTVVACALLAAFWLSQNQVIQGIVLCFLIMLATALFSWVFRCPRCRTSLIPKLAVILSKRPSVVCPKCGVSLDEPMESPANPK